MLLLGGRRNVVFVGWHLELLDVIFIRVPVSVLCPSIFSLLLLLGMTNIVRAIRLFMMIFVCCDLTFYGL
jgi:hypothetical protein